MGFLFDSLRRILAPKEHITLSQWANENFYMSAESSAAPGKWESYPYQREIMDAISDRSIRKVSLMKSSRVGYTKILNATVGYYAHQEPCPILLVQPRDSDAEDYGKEEIEPMIRDCPVLADLFPQRDGKAKGTMTMKMFPGGLLQLVGANAPGSFRRVSRKVILLDEVDAYPQSAGREGDPERLAERRADTYYDRKIVRGSTPVLEQTSKIKRAFEQGDQRRYHVPCPECGHEQYLRFEQFRWPKGRPEEAGYACESCGVIIEHKWKRWMVERGRWVAEAPDNLRKHSHASFHIWAAYSYAPAAEWGNIATEFVEAEREGYESLKTWVNTIRGEPWKDKGEAPDWKPLYQRREQYMIGTVPMGGLFLVCGVDVQKTYLAYEVVAYGRNRESWSVDAGQLMGDVATKEPWQQLDALLAKTFEHESGAEMQILAMAVDSGAFTQDVYNYCRRHTMSRVLAIKGSATSSVMLGTPQAVDVTHEGKKITDGYKVWPVGSSIIKNELYGQLRLEKPTGEGEPLPPGFIHYPEYDEEYFRQITAEQLVPHKNKKGYVTMEWEKIPGRENHGLDRRVYARAAASFCGLDRMTDKMWDALEEKIKQVQGKGKTAKPEPDDKPRGGRLGKRPKGWISGG